MRRFLAFTALLLPLAVTTLTGADKKPVAKVIDFGARLNGANNGVGHVGVTVKIVSASIAKDGTITARATIVDPDGNPLDRLGVATKGPVSMSFICAYIPAGQSQYVSYTTTVLKPTLDLTMPSQTQAANDSGGTFATNSVGDYTYTFKTKAPASFDATVTTAVGVSVNRNMSEYGTYDEWSTVSNDVFTFVPNGNPVQVTRDVTPTSACNQCHDPLIGHGGSRLQVALCVMCHTPQTINPDTGLTQDMKVLIHKIHMGSSLPSVIAGTPYRIWHRGAWSDFSSVVFPQDVRNCTTCHASPSTQAANYKTNPTAAACTSCHDDVNLATGKNHAGGPQADDKLCNTCHGSSMHNEFDATVPGAHVMPNKSATLPGVVLKVISVSNATPGNSPVVNFSVLDKKGNPYQDLSKLTSMRVVLSGSNVDYGTGTSGLRVSETPTGQSASGVYQYTMTNKIPAGATGSYTISLESRNSVTLMAGTTAQQTASDNAMPVEYYFTVDKSPVAARRQVVSSAKCSTCHSDLTFVHGGTRGFTQECAICHNPTLVDGTSGQSVNLAWQIHSIHRGESLANPYVLGTTNYQEVRFPGDLRDCTACHMTGTYLVENVGAKSVVASTNSFTKTTPPISAACQGCHDDAATASHALANTTSIGESCAACHKAGMEFGVDKVHQRIF